MNSKESLCPDAECSASVSGFVVQIWFPRHPDGGGHLYPKPIGGLNPREWLIQMPGVINVVERSEGDNYGYQVIILGEMSPQQQAEYANLLRIAITFAGFTLNAQSIHRRLPE